MMNAIARWHSKARPALGDLEQAYADRLEGEMQEMGVQLQMVNIDNKRWVKWHSKGPTVLGDLE